MMIVSNSGLHGDHVENVPDRSSVCSTLVYCNALNSVFINRIAIIHLTAQSW